MRLYRALAPALIASAACSLLKSYDDLVGEPRDAAVQGDAPVPTIPPSCQGLPATCGGARGCCDSRPVPGGDFLRRSSAALPATVGPFALDTFEVTVGRFRAFLDAGKGTRASPPAVGDGVHPKILDSGWRAEFSGYLEADRPAIELALRTCGGVPTWSPIAGSGENLPIVCVSWFEAFAFCAWDGGRLPTAAEWGFAASGGSEQREYPWGSGLDPAHACYDCRCDSDPDCTLADFLPVGAKSPAGDGRFGHADLAASAWEWGLDAAASSPMMPCKDCADMGSATDVRVFLGGSLASREASYLRADAWAAYDPRNRSGTLGFRCARAAR